MKLALIIGASIISTATLVAVCMQLYAKKKTLKRIADEGYEIAVDIIAPKTFFRKLKYGPTIPS